VDEKKVRTLYRTLQRKGFEPWMDADIEPGALWQGRIDKAIRQSDYFLACLSKKGVPETGVFRKEIELGVQYSRESPDGEAMVIPVRLEECDLPELLEGFQWVDLFRWKGRRKLFKKLRSRMPPDYRLHIAAAVLLMLFGGITTWYLLNNPYVERFLKARRGAYADPNQTLIGVTFWEYRKSIDSDPKGIRMLVEPAVADSAGAEEWTPVRKSIETEFAEGSKIRLGFESSRAGFLYVIDREQRASGGKGPIALIYPTAATKGTGNRVEAGRLVVLPTMDAKVKYWLAERKEKDYAGELLTVIVSPQRLDALDHGNVSAQELEHWTAQAKGRRVSEQRSESLTSAAEEEAAKGGTRMLTENDAPPQAIYAIAARSDEPAVIKLPLRISK
jgi:hypothetical protein